MQDITPKKLLLAVFATAIGTSILSSFAAVSFLTGVNPHRILERATETIAPTGDTAPTPRTLQSALDEEALLVSVVERAAPAVVSVVASKDVPVIERYYTNPFEGDPFFERFFGDLRIPELRERGTERREVSSGTGFIVSADGLILTNRHVVADTAADYTVFFNDGTKAPAKVLARDPFQDVAILKVEKRGLAALPLGDSNTVKIGETVIAIGNALGEFRNTVSVGVISGLGRAITASGPEGPETLAELIQTDAAINPGNSGGPLLNLKGQVIGMNTAVAQGAQGIGFAIPISNVKPSLESVKRSGKIVRPFLGVRYQSVTKGIAEEKGLPVDAGALLVSGDGESAVVPGSPAAKAGLREGDIITAVNGEAVTPTQSLASLIQRYQVGDTVTLTVRRGGETLSVVVTLEERR